LERTLVLLKPDAVQRGLVGEILRRFERKGIKIVGMKMIRVSPEMAKKLYAEHVTREFFERLISFATSSPIVALALEGDSAIHRVRALIGQTHPDDATPGTIRGDFAADHTLNLVHGSDGPESAAREVRLFFDDEDLCAYERCDDVWLGLGT
jgi:nucleoside-diphosphate kinase